MVFALSIYVPLSYATIEVVYFDIRSGAVKIRGICSCVICALVSYIPYHLLITLFYHSCFKMGTLLMKKEQNNSIKEELESEEQDRESGQEKTECMQEETEIRQREIENRQEGTESRQQENVDTKSQSIAIIDSFTDLTKAWSPMIAITFATESVVLISSETELFE